MDCLFCKIVKKEIPSYLIYEDEAAVGILDIHPQAPGHTMILPKIHAVNILELDDKGIGSVFKAVKKLTGMLKKSLNPDGFTIGINHGKASGAIVEHLHIHIMPRWSGDGGGSVHGVVNNPSKETLDQVREKILAQNQN